MARCILAQRTSGLKIGILSNEQTISAEGWELERGLMVTTMVNDGREAGVRVEMDVDEASRSEIWN